MFKIKKENSSIALNKICSDLDAYTIAASCGGELLVGGRNAGDAPTVSVVLQMTNKKCIEFEISHFSWSHVLSLANEAAWHLGATAVLIGEHQNPVSGENEGVDWEFDGEKYRSRCETPNQLAEWLAIAGLMRAAIGGESPPVWCVEWCASDITGHFFVDDETSAHALSGWIVRAVVGGASVSVQQKPLCNIR